MSVKAAWPPSPLPARPLDFATALTNSGGNTAGALAFNPSANAQCNQLYDALKSLGAKTPVITNVFCAADQVLSYTGSGYVNAANTTSGFTIAGTGSDTPQGALTGQTVTGLGRRAKYLMADLTSGDVLLMHLGMSGSFRVLKGENNSTPGEFHHPRSEDRAHPAGERRAAQIDAFAGKDV